MRALKSFTSETKQLLIRLVATLKRLTQSHEKLCRLAYKKTLSFSPARKMQLGSRPHSWPAARPCPLRPPRHFLPGKPGFLWLPQTGKNLLKVDISFVKVSLRFINYVVLLVVLLTLTLPTFALASSGTKHIDTSNVFSRTPKPLELEESKEVNSEKAKEHAETKEEKVKESATAHEKTGEASEKEKAEEEEEEASWKIPGWQSIFTALAVAFYALMLTVLPKIMAKEVEHH